MQSRATVVRLVQIHHIGAAFNEQRHAAGAAKAIRSDQWRASVNRVCIERCPSGEQKGEHGAVVTSEEEDAQDTAPPRILQPHIRPQRQQPSNRRVMPIA
jgi:hypothetical protein